MMPELPPEVLRSMLHMSYETGRLPDRSTPIGETTWDFFENSWRNAQHLLQRSSVLKVEPHRDEAPHIFRFAIDRPYKSKTESGTVDITPGPIEGTIYYRSDIFDGPPGQSAIAVALRNDPPLLHPNHNRQLGLLCLGRLPEGPFELESLLLHLYSILSYQNLSTVDLADPEAAAYFASEADAMRGLEHVEPLY